VDEYRCSDDERISCDSKQCQTKIETRYLLNVCLEIFCLQAGDFTVSCRNNRCNVLWSPRDSSDIREVSKFPVVLIPDRQSVTMEPCGLFSSMKLIVE